MSARLWPREDQIALAVKMVDGHAGALDFVRGLTAESVEGYDLLEQLDIERPEIKGIVLWNASKRAGQAMAIAPTGSVSLTFAGIARRMLL